MNYYLLPILLTLGCTVQNDLSEGPELADTSSSTRVSEPSKTEVPLSEVQLKVVDEAGFEQVLNQHQGQVILVDFWATWCAPCLKQLPHTFSLSRRYATDGLAVVSVCLDEPDNKENALALLSRCMDPNDNVENLMSEYGGGSRAMEAFAIEGGALPHYKIFDREGKLQTTFSLDPSAAEQFTPADIEKAVTELLSQE